MNKPSAVSLPAYAQGFSQAEPHLTAPPRQIPEGTDQAWSQDFGPRPLTPARFVAAALEREETLPPFPPQRAGGLSR